METVTTRRRITGYLSVTACPSSDWRRWPDTRLVRTVVIVTEMENWPMRDDVCVCVCVCVMVVWKCCPLQCLLDIRTSIPLLWKFPPLLHCSSCQFCSNPWSIAGFSGLVTACWVNFFGENNGYVKAVTAPAPRLHSKYVHFWTPAVDTVLGELTLPASVAAECHTAHTYCAVYDTFCPTDTFFQHRAIKTAFGAGLLWSYMTSQRTVRVYCQGHSGNSCHVDRAGQLQPSTGASNSLRPRLRAANVGHRGGWNALEGRYLLTVGWVTTLQPYWARCSTESRWGSVCRLRSVELQM